MSQNSMHCVAFFVREMITFSDVETTNVKMSSNLSAF